MLGWCLVAAGVAFGSALLPLISVEVFVLGLAAHQPTLPCVAVGVAVAIGQMAGKLPYYLAARGSLHLPAFLHRRRERDRPSSALRDRWRRRSKRLRGWLDALTERCHRHPHWMFTTYGISSVVGLPPFMATTVLAGLARMSPTTFLCAGLVGRCVRFSLLAASPVLLAHWLSFTG